MKIAQAERYANSELFLKEVQKTCIEYILTTDTSLTNGFLGAAGCFLTGAGGGGVGSRGGC